MRLDIRRIGNIQDKEQTVGARTRVKVVKNKLAPPFRSIEIDVMFGRGFCKAGDLLDLAEESGVIEKSGSWYAMGDTKLGQGRERVRERLLTEPALFAQIEAAVRASAPATGTAEA